MYCLYACIVKNFSPILLPSLLMTILLHSYSNYCYIFQNFKLTVTSEDGCCDIRNVKSVKKIQSCFSSTLI